MSEDKPKLRVTREQLAQMVDLAKHVHDTGDPAAADALRAITTLGQHGVEVVDEETPGA